MERSTELLLVPTSSLSWCQYSASSWEVSTSSEVAKQKSFSKVSEQPFWRRPPRDPFSQKRSMTEAVWASSLAKASMAVSTGVVLETESKTAMALWTAGSVS